MVINRHALVAIGVVMLFVASLFVAAITQADAAQPKKLVCTGEVVGGTYHSVEVPRGASCELVNVTVQHNVKSLHGARDVRVLNSEVGGNVHVRNATGTVHIGQQDCRFDPKVRVNVMVKDSHHVLICYVTGHVLQVTGNDGRITVRDNNFHQIKVSRNEEFTGSNARRGTIRILRNDANRHIHVFGNHPSRNLVLKGNSPKPIVR